MMTLCPHCGHVLTFPLSNGISSCNNCNRIFDSGYENRLLSGGWVVRKQFLDDPQYLVENLGYSQEDAELIVNFVGEKCLPHDEWRNWIHKELLINLGS